MENPSSTEKILFTGRYSIFIFIPFFFASPFFGVLLFGVLTNGLPNHYIGIPLGLLLFYLFLAFNFYVYHITESSIVYRYIFSFGLKKRAIRLNNIELAKYDFKRGGTSESPAYTIVFKYKNSEGRSKKVSIAIHSKKDMLNVLEILSKIEGIAMEMITNDGDISKFSTV